MEVSGYFWALTIVMAVAAFGFIAMPLVKNNRKTALISVAIAVPLLAAGMYLQLGSPNVATNGHKSLPSQSSSADRSGNTGEQKIGTVASMVDGLASRLRDNPDDGGSWLLLARSYKHLNRMDEAIGAYEHAAKLGQYDADLAAISGGDVAAQTAISGGEVAAPASPAQIFGNVKLSPAASAIVLPTDTVFIFAKAVNGPPAPLAILQRPASELPMDFLLNDSQSMIAGMKLSDFDEVVVTARITRDGSAMVALQGLEAKSDTVLVAENRHLNLIIEK